jgi:hypothetical protein
MDYVNVSSQPSLFNRYNILAVIRLLDLMETDSTTVLLFEVMVMMMMMLHRILAAV